MSITKKAKKVRVTWVETKSYYSKYICPSCWAESRCIGVTKGTLRFRCDCGQEFIVESVSPSKGGQQMAPADSLLTDDCYDENDVAIHQHPCHPQHPTLNRWASTQCPIKVKK